VSTLLSPDEIELDRLWRQRFGQPLPILGCADLIRTLLGEDGCGAVAAGRPPIAPSPETARAGSP
jgi:hypothetical protein